MCSSSSSAWCEMLCGLVCSFMASPVCARLRDGFDRIDDRLIAGAAAVVPRNVLADCVATGYAALGKQVLRGEQHRRRAEAALQRVAPAERILQVGDVARVRHALDSLYRCAVALCRERETAAHDRTVEPHRAGTAHAVLAADMAAGQPQGLAQEVDQGQARLDRLGDALAVHGQTDVELTHASPMS